VQALKHAEQLARVLLLKAGSVVAHEEDRAIVRLRGSELNPGISNAARKFPRVVDLVEQR
jgi:hypothetical protein